MNATPHEHKLEIRVSECYTDLTYGDQDTFLPNGCFFFDRRLRRAARRLVRLHDRESVKASGRSDIIDQLRREPPRSRWAKTKVQE